MGVPKFYRWISERYPCLSEVVKDYQVSLTCCHDPCCPAGNKTVHELGTWWHVKRTWWNGLKWITHLRINQFKVYFILVRSQFTNRSNGQSFSNSKIKCPPQSSKYPRVSGYRHHKKSYLFNPFMLSWITDENRCQQSEVFILSNSHLLHMIVYYL